MASMIVGEMREGKGSIKKGSNMTLTYSSTFHFLVVTDDKFTTREEVLLYTPGLPIVGVVYGLIQATCTGIDADRRKDNPIYWDVTCTFDTQAEQQKQNPEDPDNPDPTTWIPLWNVDSFEGREKALKEDYSPTPLKCLNSANTPFGDPLIDVDTLCSWPFTQFESASLKLKAIMDRNAKTNKTSVTYDGETFSARTLKLNVLAAAKGIYMQFPAWRIEYRLTYDPSTWDEVRLDVGPTNINGEACVSFKNKFRIVGNLNGSGIQTYGAPAEKTFITKKPIEFNDFLRTA